MLRWRMCRWRRHGQSVGRNLQLRRHPVLLRCIASVHCIGALHWRIASGECTLRECTLRECTLRECALRECTLRECALRECTVGGCAVGGGITLGGGWLPDSCRWCSA
uniref:pentapeptide repeat-containing protein n=1 Tax=Paludibacterium sp. THUN1379 TaxID=3112107 RepID=UPI00403F4EC2